jgi:hypothetical protein
MSDAVFSCGKNGSSSEPPRKRCGNGVKNPRRRAEYRAASHTKWKRPTKIHLPVKVENARIGKFSI